MVHVCLQAAQKLEKDGVSAEVVDLRSLRPLDVEAILRSVHKTNRAVYVEEGWSFGGIGAHHRGPDPGRGVRLPGRAGGRVTQADVPMPYAKQLEKAAKPSAERRRRGGCEKVLYR
jgi:pyruvate/2-oxoglutarate/acetoin dehydrogenase E1 component